MDLLARLGRAARAFDDLPLSPASIGYRLIERSYEQTRRSALRDPQYAEIEARRRSDRGGVLYLSEVDGLGLPELEYQSAVEARVRPAWSGAARKLSKLSLAAPVGQVAEALQRGRRGYAQRDLYGFDIYLAKTVGSALVDLADAAHGHPAGYTFEAWVEALRGNGQKLLAFADPDHESERLTAWHALATDPATAGTDQEREALKALEDLRASTYREAQEALHWVADNVGRLWD